ncbi:hypothetical protein A2Z67_02900 [Candidatus Woesebacteria bacterium RBG_13_36_22]|uniref:Uncharacterized protein n=1 Tax=Candidatus Woesebacteria bacterium RBG_13_36_22 TaxID=1802478 RepID=A0A1F7X5W0_9BACT|nr:MAG: hypothetical protein A2Z67_02900 [Candidatus Woesebacteria bacterium RBG_13_36_22]
MADKKLNIIEGGKKWFRSLVGKTTFEDINILPEADTSQELQEQQEDSVANDIRMFKDFAKRNIEKTKTILTPFAKKGASSATDVTKVVSSSVDNKFIKALVRSFLIIFFVIVLIFIATYLFKTLKKENGIVHNNGVSVTPVPFEPYKPSIYAQDAEVLKLEEDVNILERELAEVKIKEDGINPPKLDYDISF